MGGSLQVAEAAKAAGWTGRSGSGDFGYRGSTAEGEENLLTTSLALLSVAVALGAALLAGLAWHRVALVHGSFGAAGAVAAGVAASHGRLHGPFGGVVLGLLLAALCGGVLLWRGWRPGLAVFLHVMAGGVAYLLLTGAAFS